MIISFIIPVYNTGCYLERCLESLFNQGIDESLFEVIIINDGSTDDSAQIIETLVKGRPSIQFLNTENRGLGAARNTGINIARGKYLFFVDSDDYLFENSLLPLCEYAESATDDIIGFDWAYVYFEGNIVRKKRKAYTYNSPMTGAEYLIRFNLSGGACPYLFSASLLKDTPILMPEGIYHEDELFLSEVFTFARKVLFVNQLVYAYHQRDNSITHNKSLIDKRITDILYILDRHISLREGANLPQLQREGLDRRIDFLTVDFIINLIRFYADKALINRVVQQLSSRKIYPLPQRPYSWKYKFFRTIFNYKQSITLASKFGFFKANI